MKRWRLLVTSANVVDSVQSLNAFARSAACKYFERTILFIGFVRLLYAVGSTEAAIAAMQSTRVRNLIDRVCSLLSKAEYSSFATITGTYTEKLAK